MQAEHSQLEFCFSTSFLKPSSAVAGTTAAAAMPNENLGASIVGLILPKPLELGAGLLPGFGVSQQRHLSLLASFLVIHSLHSHCDCFCVAARFLNKSSLVGAGGIPKSGGGATAAGLLPGFGVSQHKHFVFALSFLAMQASHSHWVLACLAASVLNKSSAGGDAFIFVVVVVDAAAAAGFDANAKNKLHKVEVYLWNFKISHHLFP